MGSWCARFIYIYISIYNIDSQQRPVVIVYVCLPTLYVARKSYCLSLTWSIEYRFLCSFFVLSRSLSLSLSLSLNSGEKSPGCLPGLSQPGHALSNFSIYWFIMISSVYIQDRIGFNRMKEIVCLRFLYQLQQHSWIMQFLRIIFWNSWMLFCVCTCLHSVCIILRLFPATIQQTTPEQLQRRLSIGLITMAQLCP